MKSKQELQPNGCRAIPPRPEGRGFPRNLMTPSPKIYIAGPDVFRADAVEMGNAKKAICAKYGFEGLFPLDNEVNLEGLAPFLAGMSIYRGNIELMNQADLIVANMTPFRGPSLDAGTGFEIGYMTGQGKPVWGYSLDGRLYADRIAQDTKGRDLDGLLVERFDMADNLMLVGAIECSGGQFICQNAIDLDSQPHLAMFEQVIQTLSKKEGVDA